jgi:molybdate transport system substrate-binding protein
MSDETISGTESVSATQLRLFIERIETLEEEKKGIADDIKDRMVIPPPGTPVARLIASGEVALGFQQQSELMGVTGVTVIAALPAEVAIDTIFSAAVAQTTGHAEMAQQLIAHWNSTENVSLKQAHGMQAV